MRKVIILLLVYFIAFTSCTSDIDKINGTISDHLADKCIKYIPIETIVLDSITPIDIEGRISLNKFIIVSHRFMQSAYVEALEDNEVNYNNTMKEYRECEIRHLKDDFLRLADDFLELVDYYEQKVNKYNDTISLLQSEIQEDSLCLIYLSEIESSTPYYISVLHRYYCDSILIEETLRIDPDFSVISY